CTTYYYGSRGAMDYW
nr:immunoglobulin heavy chain junction region [Mus musculus]